MSGNAGILDQDPFDVTEGLARPAPGPADSLAIRNLVDRYGLGLDLRDTGAFEDLWADDGVLEVFQDGPSAPSTGRLRARRNLHLAFEALEAYERTVHHMTAHHAWAAGPHEAGGLTSCHAHHLRDGEDLIMHIRYADRYARVDDRWRFSHRRVEVLATTVCSADVLR